MNNLTYKECVEAKFLKESDVSFQIIQTVVNKRVRRIGISAMESVYDTADQEL